MGNLTGNITGLSIIIGVNGKIPWELKEDLIHFKKITLGSAIIMGRKTISALANIPSKKDNKSKMELKERVGK